MLVWCEPTICWVCVFDCFNYFQLCWNMNMKTWFERCFDEVLLCVLNDKSELIYILIEFYWGCDVNCVICDCENDPLKYFMFLWENYVLKAWTWK